ncbi:serine-rich and transmembrane domain-containing protein 1 isoform X2 [Nannospalax galili]|uniref:serine-rich and transmembrane domain-containing protein 1 isoform X2 n=1 Tax=Nannospalax galili TaxID=1026970 RepID=UPI000819E9AB|nr:serine-rich and transmembrane domain-containing protein 1 isoform X2 [Nannospalax galili]
MTRLVTGHRENLPSILQRVISPFLGTQHAHTDGWRCSALCFQESSRLSSIAPNPKKFVPALNTWVPSGDFSVPCKPRKMFC